MDKKPKLWKVTVEYLIIVLADTEDEAEFEAEQAVGASDPWNTIAREIKELKNLPKEYYNSVPFGGNDDKNCKQLLENEGN